jgi:hypothetical protein
MKKKPLKSQYENYPPKKDIPKYTDNFRSIYDKRLAKKMLKKKTFQSLNP